MSLQTTGGNEKEEEGGGDGRYRVRPAGFGSDRHCLSYTHSHNLSLSLSCAPVQALRSGWLVLPLRLSQTGRRTSGGATRRTRGSTSPWACGASRGTPTTSARRCCGEWREPAEGVCKEGLGCWFVKEVREGVEVDLYPCSITHTYPSLFRTHMRSPSFAGGASSSCVPSPLTMAPSLPPCWAPSSSSSS